MSLILAMILAQGTPAATASTANDDSKVVCRTTKGTGSRLSSQRVCLPKREWQRMWDESRSTMGSLQDRQMAPTDNMGPK